MKLKNRIIEKLLKIGKKNRILAYPMLVLISIVSVFANAFTAACGSRKKLTASVMIVVMLLTQSMFLTSSADYEGGQTAESAGTATDAPVGSNTDPDTVNKKVVIYYHAVQSDGVMNLGHIDVEADDNGKVSVLVPDDQKKAELMFNDAGQTKYFSFSESYISDKNEAPAFSDEEISYSGQTILLDKPESKEYHIFFRATRTSYPYKVYKDNSKEELFYDSANYDKALTVVNPVAGVLAPAVSFELWSAAEVNAYKRGYTYNGVVYDGRMYKLIEGVENNITVTPSGYVDALEFVAGWKPKSFNITFDALAEAPDDIKLNAGATNPKDILYEYGSEMVLPDDNEVWAKNEAYVLSGWKILGDSSEIVYSGNVTNSSVFAEDFGDVTDENNIKGKTLIAVWKYRNTKLNISNTEDAYIDEAGTTVIATGTYGDEFDCTLFAEYNEGRPDNVLGKGFEYIVGDVDGVNGSTLLGKYGIECKIVYATENGVRYQTGISLKGQFDDVTELLEVPITVVDTNHSNAESHYTIRVSIKKKVVALDKNSIKDSDGENAPTKQYDGSEKIGISNIASLVVNSSTTPGQFTRDEVYVYFGSSSATMDDSAAGKGKNLTLHNVSLTGKDAYKYEIKDLTENNELYVEGVAEVTKKPISIVVEPKKSSEVYFGQNTPEFIIKFADASELAGDTIAGDEYAYKQIETDSQREDFMRSYLGFTGWVTVRKNFSPVGEYSITPEFKGKSNYLVSLEGATADFTVIRNKPVKDMDYVYSSSPVNGYYKELSIKLAPGSKYDGIRLLSDNDTDINNDMGDNVNGFFKSSVSVTDTNSKKIRFQLIDFETGEITEIATDEVKVDTSSPEYVSHTVEPTPNLDYFHLVSFGTYYHSQNDIETVLVTFNFKADYSACDTLHYYFVDENGNKGSETTRVMTKSPLGYYTCTVPIGTTESGRFVVYAVNEVGNKSDELLVKFDTTEDYTGRNDFYEWMVENKPAVISDWQVSDAAGNTDISTSDWHEELRFELSATDNNSGLWKIDWNISVEDAEGNVTKLPTVTEDVKTGLGAVFKDYGKVTAYDFSYALDKTADAGRYYIEAIVYDNAGNKTVANKIGPYKLDSSAPVITDMTKPVDENYFASRDFIFTAAEMVNESQIFNVMLYRLSDDGDTKKDELLKTWDAQDEYTYKIDRSGVYRVVATDNAGNVSTYETSFEGISSVKPSNPEIKLEGTMGLNGWYKEEAVTVTIIGSDKTSDGIPVTNYYSVGMASDSDAIEMEGYSATIEVKNQGQVVIKAWSVSKSGAQSDIVSEKYMLDTDAPSLEFTGSSKKDGKLFIDFAVTDIVSGVDADSIMLNGIKLETKEELGAIKGSFEVGGQSSYIFTVADKAGNACDDIEYTPLKIEAAPVVDITASQASLEVKCIEGSNKIKNCYIMYRKSGEEDYVTAPYSNKNKDYGIYSSCEFSRLESDTVYEYLIYAIAENTDEECIVTGAFRTLDTKDKGIIEGTATYSDAIAEGYDKYPVYISLYDGNTYIAGKVIEDADDRFVFENVPDGTYRVEATDGFYKKSESVSILDGSVTAPSDYMEKDGMLFVMSGFSTRVEIDDADGDFNFSVSGFDDIYKATLENLYNLLTEEEKLIIADGGNVEMVLHVSLLEAGELDERELEIIGKKLDEEAEIQKYLNLYITKTVYDKDKKQVGLTTRVTDLRDPITLQIPLGELSGKNVHIGSTHKEVSGAYTFKKEADYDMVKLDNDYMYVSSRYFSIYVLYTMPEVKNYYTVTWLDRNSNVIYTEEVEEGQSANPPTGFEKEYTDGDYKYTFSAWKPDYSVVTGPMTIQPWYTREYIGSTTEKPTTETPSTEAPTTERPTGGADTNRPGKDDATTEEKVTTESTSQEIVIVPPKKDDIDPEINKKPVDFTDMNTSNKPQTGDEYPLYFIICIMAISAAGFILTAKPRKKN